MPQYGKLTDNGFIGSEQQLDGYLPVEMNTPTEEPLDGYVFDYEWATDGEKIYRVWKQVEYVDYQIEPSEGEYAETARILLGVKE